MSLIELSHVLSTLICKRNFFLHIMHCFHYYFIYLTLRSVPRHRFSKMFALFHSHILCAYFCRADNLVSWRSNSHLLGVFTQWLALLIKVMSQWLEVDSALGVADVHHSQFPKWLPYFSHFLLLPPDVPLVFNWAIFS